MAIWPYYLGVILGCKLSDLQTCRHTEVQSHVVRSCQLRPTRDASKFTPLFAARVTGVAPRNVHPTAAVIFTSINIIQCGSSQKCLAGETPIACLAQHNGPARSPGRSVSNYWSSGGGRIPSSPGLATPRRIRAKRDTSVSLRPVAQSKHIQLEDFCQPQRERQASANTLVQQTPVAAETSDGIDGIVWN